MKIFVLDNYDSFTYNLVQIIEEIAKEEVVVCKNDKVSLSEISIFDKIVLSPGPGIPSEAGMLLDIIKFYSGKIPILGVCLGHQAIAEAFGGSLVHLDKIYHGVASDAHILKSKSLLFQNLPKTIKVGRYHSWAVNPDNIPEELEITAVDNDGIIMALQHKYHNLHTVQFHPESVLTPYGKVILENFIRE
ncbi:anthranilate synthase component II [Riemerella columbipharyngis]|uniref:Anthranilate synthase component 2 n=1 Tax=Riemerella columbipharyngis TaxID=1071918 RepID=A0A1G6YKJ3_9FLAO|nr:aminodeoxychorismate/anthranilate synthase component II [Riemerella columbipharyngis]SDD90898.1 anthranilate synthase component 2 [Riemerella columbipharyngis]